MGGIYRMPRIKEIQNEYTSILDLLQTEMAINEIKTYFENTLCDQLNLIRVSAPLLVKSGYGINDNLNGVERVVSLDAKNIKGIGLEIVQSLAKWKRAAIYKYGFGQGEGLYTDMRAIRRDEILDNLHSLYVDQWDWEKVISKEDRNLTTLKNEVRKIYNSIRLTEEHLHDLYPALTPVLPEEIFFITSLELEKLYPSLSPKEREEEITKEYGAVFLMQIGAPLLSGEKHDGRSPDYDDWTLNGDIILWSTVLGTSIEISSMGIRVDKETLLRQLRVSNNEDRKELEFHQSIISEKFPLTIGGGIGQSRLNMFLLKKRHIGEVQASVWNEEIIVDCKRKNINLL
jgi:aspartate--ammonia ligase